MGPLRGLRQFGLGGGFLEPGVCSIGALRGLRCPGPAGAFLIGVARAFLLTMRPQRQIFMEPHGGLGPSARIATVSRQLTVLGHAVRSFLAKGGAGCVSGRLGFPQGVHKHTHA